MLPLGTKVPLDMRLFGYLNYLTLPHGHWALGTGWHEIQMTCISCISFRSDKKLKVRRYVAYFLYGGIKNICCFSTLPYLTF